MKANLVLLSAVLFALVFHTASLSYRHDVTAAPTAGAAPANTQNTAPNTTSAASNTAPNPANPAPAQTPSAGSPAKPAVKLCAFNKLSTVPGSPEHTFSVTNIQSAKYENKDFDVAWKEVKVKKHKFFQKIGQKSNFGKSFPIMKCQITDQKGFGAVCNYKDTEVNQYYKNAFGTDLIFKCVVPQEHFVLSYRFVLQLSDFPTGAGGRWSIFGGLHQFKSQEDANKKIQEIAKKIVDGIKSSKLNTFDINSNLNIIPDFVKGTLSWVFSSNANSPFVKTAQKGKKYDLSDVGYIKILPPGTEFIIGSIYNGTTAVKQICDNFRFDNTKDDCGYKL